MSFWSLYGQDFSEINKTVASDRSSGDRFGYAVDVSGNYAVVGALGEDFDEYNTNYAEDAGAAYIFERDINGNWIEVQKIVASDRDEKEDFGRSVSISGDYIFVGAPDDDWITGDTNNYHSGAVYIYERQEFGNWLEVQKIIGFDIDITDRFGFSVSVYGNSAVIGADKQGIEWDNNGGAVYVFIRDENGTWVESQKIIASDGDPNDRFGFSVSIHESQVIVGANRDNFPMSGIGGDSGSAYIFERDSVGVWIEVEKLVASDWYEDVLFGSSVSIYNDFALVGAYLDNHDEFGENYQYRSGSAYLFKRDSTGAWNERQKIVASDREAGNWFGSAVALSDSIAIIGACQETEDSEGLNFVNSAGAVYQFELNDSGYLNEVDKIVASDRDGLGWFGDAAAISENNIIVGAWFEGHDENGQNGMSIAGAAYIFEKRCSMATSSSFSMSVCESYTVPSGDSTYTSSQLINDTIINLCGADSIMTIDLTITPPSYTVDTHMACDSFTWIDGNTYTESDSLSSYYLTSVLGCDSIVTLDLTINNTTYSSDTHAVCDTFLWMDGVTYTESNYIATYVLTNEAGCDSIVTLKLTLSDSESVTDTYIVCDSLTWLDGITYTESNTSATHSITTEAGCDSLINLDLTIVDINPEITIIANTMHVEQTGATYQWIDCADSTSIAGATQQEYTPTVSGDYAVMVSTEVCSAISNCESIVITGVIEIDNNPFELKILPNPNSGLFILSSSAVGGIYSIISVDGRTILNDQIIRSEYQTIDLSYVVAGNYFVKVTHKDFNVVTKLVIW